MCTPIPIDILSHSSLSLRFDFRNYYGDRIRGGELRYIFNDSLPFRSGCDCLQNIGTVKPKFRNDVIRRGSASWTWRRSSDLDFLYLFDGIHHRHVLAEVVFIELFRALLTAFVKSIDHPAPSLALAVVDLAEIKHRPLYHSTAGAALALDNAPVTVLLAVLTSSSESQIHQRRFYSNQNARKGSRSSLQRFSMPRPL